MSDRSQRALQRAVSLARQFGSQLWVLHVVDDDQPLALVDEECRATAAALQGDLDRGDGGDLTPVPTVTVLAGDPFRVIVDEANQVEADLTSWARIENACLAIFSQAQR